MNVFTFPKRWKYPLPDMTDPVNRAAWEALVDMAHRDRTLRARTQGGRA